MENRKLKILAIDDNSDNLLSLKALINDSFPEALVLSSVNGKDGIKLADAYDPDVILLDVVMPGMDGFAVCQKLKSDEKLADIPVVFITAIKGDKESRIRALDCGGEAFLAKPIDESELTAQIRAMVKIKYANIQKRSEKKYLTSLVSERNEQLRIELVERQRAESDLHKSYDLLHKLTSQVPGVVYQYRLYPDGRSCFPYSSVGMYEIYELMPEKVRYDATPVFSRIHPEDREYIVESINESARNLSLYHSEFRVILPEKGLRWRTCNAKPERLPDGSTLWHGIISDSTDKKQAEIELEASNEFNNSLLRTIPFGMDIVDEYGKILFQNEKIKEFSAVKGTANTCWELYRDHKTQCENCPLINGIEIGKTATLETSDVLGNKIFEITHTGMMFNGKKAILEIFHDITDRKQAENALRESDDRYRSFISQVSEGVYRLETDRPMDLNLSLEEQVDYIYDNMFVAECNTAFLKMYGASEQHEIIGKGHLDFHGGRHNQLNRDQLRQFILNGYRIENGTTEEKNIAGQSITISNNSLGIIKNNHLVRIWGTQIDITEKIETEHIQGVLYTISNAALTSKDLQELIEIISDQLRQLFHSNNFYIAFYDEKTGMLSTQYDVDERDQIDRWPAGKSLTGYVIRNQKSLLADEDEKMKMYESGDIEKVGTSSKVWLGVPMIAKGKAIGAIVVQSYDDPEAFNEKDKMILEFISQQIALSVERKKAEQDIKHALLKAQESDRLKSAFLANMSHEIRTPMNGILGFAELLKEPGLTGEDQQEYITIIEKSGIRMLNIINDIVDISKIEAGLMEVRFIETNVNKQLDYIYTFFKPEVDKKGITLSYKYSLPTDVANILTDREKLYAILINLVKNAIKYSHEGTIEFGYNHKLSQDSLTVESGITSTVLEFYVKDDGIGIPNDRQEAIFERFVQADIADKHAHQGAGLGLAITKAYVEMLGGKIWVESNTNAGSGQKGSVFYFTIPYSLKTRSDNEFLVSTMKANGNHQIKKLKILIVEDEAASDMLMSIELSKYGHNLYHAKNGVEAIELCRNNPDIDLVMMDIKMPVMDGYIATSQIRNFNNKVIIIAQTAFALMGDKEKAIQVGCNDYITKPINKQLLLKMIGKYFHN
ncbi:MAG: response regulator [Bacteroidales bacterium]|nr:response regulator [Bacteroidales bacterium]